MEDKERRRKPMEIFRGAKLSFILQKMNETLSYGWIEGFTSMAHSKELLDS
jgi:hypothetical protein